MGTTVEVNNINIWYEEFGDKSNETILLIMGANANCMQWDQEFIDRLVANNFHVVRFDNRDVGKSTWFGKEPAFNKFLKLLPNFLLRIIVNSIFGLAVDDKGKFKFNNPNPEYTLSDMAKDAVALLEVLNIKKADEIKIDDNFAKNLGAKNLTDLKNLLSKQISVQYKQALDSITKQQILDQLEKIYSFDLPEGLVSHELSNMTQNLKQEDKDKHKKNNEKIASNRIKLSLILNEYGVKFNVKVSEEEIKGEVQKQIKSMPQQEKMVIEYYKKNPQALQSLRGALYEDKIISSIKSKMKIETREILSNQAEKIISDFNKPKKNETLKSQEVKKSSQDTLKNKQKTKKISKK